jgi:hypothetical protein
MAEFEWGRDSRPVEDDDFEWGRDSTPVEDAKPTEAAKPTIDELKAQARGQIDAAGRWGLHSATAGFADEAVGWLESKLPALKRTPEEFIEGLVSGKRAEPQSRQQNRDDHRALLEKSRKDHPAASTGGELLGALALPIPGGAAAKGAKFLARAGRSVAQGAGLGGAYGLGVSEADLAGGDIKGAAKDAAKGAAWGAAGGAVGEGIVGGGGRAVQWLRERAKKGSEEAAAASRAAVEALQLKNERSLLGKYRSEVQSASRDLEVLERAAAGADDVAEQARAYLASPEGDALRRQITLNKLKTAPDRIAEMQASKKAYDELAAGREESVAAQTAEKLRNPFEKHIKPRLKTLGARFGPSTIAAIGGIAGGPAGAVAGGLVGGIVSVTQGARGRIIKNMMKEPANRKFFWDRVAALAGANPTKAGAVVRALETAAQQGERAFTTKSFILSQRDPIARAMLQRAAEADKEMEDEEGALAVR